MTENKTAESRSQVTSGKRLLRDATVVLLSLLGAGVVSWAMPRIASPPPPPAPSSSTTPSLPAASGESPARPVLQPTVMLPTSPAPATAEQLQQESTGVAQELQSRFPDRAEALHVAAMLHSQLRQTEQAEALWRRCLELDPKNGTYSVNLAALAMDRGNTESALETLQQAVDRGFSSPDLFYHLAIALTQAGRCAEAEVAIAKSLALEPQSGSCWLVLGQAQLKGGKLSEAEMSLRKAIDLGLKTASAYFALANACARQGKAEEAGKYRELFQQLSANEPLESQERYKVLSTAEARRIAVVTLCEAATVHAWGEDFLESERLFLRALALDPASADACRALAALYHNARKGAEERVVRRRLVELEPRRFMNYAELAKLSAELGEPEAAEATLKLAMVARPDAAEAYATLAQFHLESGRVDYARWYAQEAVRREPTAEGYLFLASTCRLLGDVAEAEAALAMARKLDPHHPQLAPSSPTTRGASPAK